jgi:hypothetical protein
MMNALMKKPRTGGLMLHDLAVGLALLSCVSIARAHPYASGVTVSGGNVSYILNESATDVKVLFDNSTVTNDLGAMAAGLQSFALGTHTNFSISVFKLGPGVPTAISPAPGTGVGQSPLVDFVAPRGVNVNRNPQRKNFGRIYVANAMNSSDTVRSVTKGVYVLNADCSDALGYGNTAQPPLPSGTAWGGSPNYSPYKLFVGPDDMVYVGDSSFYTSSFNCGAPVWMVDPDLTTATALFGYIGTAGGSTVANVNSGPCHTTPFVTGSLATGDLQLTCGMWNYISPDAGGLWNGVYQYNIGSGPIGPGTNNPWTQLPVTLPTYKQNGASVGVAWDLYIAPNGYIFYEQNRGASSGGIASGNNTLFIYDSTGVNQLWLSSVNGAVGGLDPFVGAYAMAISPDGQYLALANASATFKWCKLTNGLPDISTLQTNATLVGNSSRGIAFDAADNVYITGGGVNYSGGKNLMQIFSLGLTTTAVTSNDRTGTNGFFALSIPPSTVSVTAIAKQASQAGPTPGTFQLTRAGQYLNLPFTINFTLTGTAGSDIYTVSPSVGSGAIKSITFDANQTTTNITITPINDSVPRLTTTVILTVLGGSTYTSGNPGADTITIQNIGPQQLQVSGVAAPTMYKAFSNDYASFYVQRLGDTNATAYTATAFTYAGTAVTGLDYTLPSVTINPGDVQKAVTISPLVNGELPQDTNTVYTGNKTVVIGMAAGSGYTVAPSSGTATLTILDNVQPPGMAVLYTNSLADPADMANWNLTFANTNMADPGYAADYDVQMGFNLSGAPYGPIGSPPSGSLTALRMTVNKNGYGASAGANLYPTNVSFSGNYAMRFQMNLIQGGNNLTYNEGALFGINHTGTNVNWWANDILSGSGVWQSDGIWFWVSATPNGILLGDYLGFTGGNGLPNTGWAYQTGSGSFSRTASYFTGAFKDPAVFSTLVGISAPAPGSGIPANCGPVLAARTTNPNPQANWADVEIKQLNNIITLSIDQTPILIYTNRTTYTHGTVMLGYNDPVSDVGYSDGAVYYANLSVVSLPPLALHITGIAINNSTNVVINFTSTDLEDLSSAFAVLGSSSAASVTTPVVAVITQVAPGTFQAVVPKAAPMAFYRVRHL